MNIGLATGCRKAGAAIERIPPTKGAWRHFARLTFGILITILGAIDRVPLVHATQSLSPGAMTACGPDFGHDGVLLLGTTLAMSVAAGSGSEEVKVNIGPIAIANGYALFASGHVLQIELRNPPSPGPAPIARSIHLSVDQMGNPPFGTGFCAGGAITMVLAGTCLTATATGARSTGFLGATGISGARLVAPSRCHGRAAQARRSHMGLTISVVHSGNWPWSPAPCRDRYVANGSLMGEIMKVNRSVRTVSVTDCGGPVDAGRQHFGIGPRSGYPSGFGTVPWPSTM